jgi:hypothetical protein
LKFRTGDRVIVNDSSFTPHMAGFVGVVVKMPSFFVLEDAVNVRFGNNILCYRESSLDLLGQEARWQEVGF